MWSQQRNQQTGNSAMGEQKEPGIIELSDEEGKVKEDVEEVNPFPFMKRWKPRPKADILECEESEAAMEPALPPKSFLYKYKLLDSDKVQLANNYNLTERLADIVWGPQIEPGQMAVPQQTTPAHPNFKRCFPGPRDRYFQTITKLRESAICRNCRHKGHTARHCTVVVSTVCIYCLGHHSAFYNCLPSCTLPLHIEVRQRNGSVEELCARCQRSNHHSRKCGYLALETSSSSSYQKLIEPTSSQLSSVICLRCSKPGHFNCTPQPTTSDDGLFTYEKLHRPTNGSPEK